MVSWHGKRIHCGHYKTEAEATVAVKWVRKKMGLPIDVQFPAGCGILDYSVNRLPWRAYQIVTEHAVVDVRKKVAG